MEEFPAASLTINGMGDHVRVSVLGRERPDASDHGDGNWLMAMVDVKVGGFMGSYVAALRSDEFSAFRDQLRELDRDPLTPGVAELASMEGWLDLHVELASNGGLIVKGQAMDRAGDGNRLAFDLRGLDQTFMHSWLGELDDLLEQFPVRGRLTGS